MMAAKQFGKICHISNTVPTEWTRLMYPHELLPSQTDRHILYELVSRKAANLVIIALHGDLSKLAPLADQNLLTLDEDGFFNAHRPFPF